MPWTPADAPKHNKKLSGASKNKWASIANSVLAQTGDEGKAVRIANAKVKPTAIQRKLKKRSITGA